MFGIILYDVIFFAVPALLLLFFGISLYRYISAKRENEETPGSYSIEEIKNVNGIGDKKFENIKELICVK